MAYIRIFDHLTVYHKTKSSGRCPSLHEFRIFILKKQAPFFKLFVLHLCMSGKVKIYIFLLAKHSTDDTG